MLDLAHRQDNLEEGSDSWFDLSIQGRFQFEESPGADNVWTAKTGYATLLDLLMVIIFVFVLLYNLKKLAIQCCVFPLNRKIQMASPLHYQTAYD